MSYFSRIFRGLGTAQPRKLFLSKVRRNTLKSRKYENCCIRSRHLQGIFFQKIYRFRTEYFPRLCPMPTNLSAVSLLSSRLSGICQGFQLNSAGKQLKIVISRKMKVESRHFYGITIVSDKLLNAEILNGVHISQFIPGFRALGYREHVKDSTSKVRGNS